MDTIQRLTELLEDRNMTLYMLAKTSDVNYGTLYASVKRGSQLSVDTIEKLCVGFGIELYEFFMTSKDWDSLENYILRRHHHGM